MDNILFEYLREWNIEHELEHYVHCTRYIVQWKLIGKLLCAENKLPVYKTSKTSVLTADFTIGEQFKWTAQEVSPPLAIGMHDEAC